MWKDTIWTLAQTQRQIGKVSQSWNWNKKLCAFLRVVSFKQEAHALGNHEVSIKVKKIHFPYDVLGYIYLTGFSYGTWTIISHKSIHTYIDWCLCKPKATHTGKEVGECVCINLTMKRSSSDWLNMPKFCFSAACISSIFSSLSKLEMSPTWNTSTKGSCLN